MATQFNDDTRTGIQPLSGALEKLMEQLEAPPQGHFVKMFHVGTKEELRERLADIPIREGEEDE